MKKLLFATDGKVFTVKTLGKLVGCTHGLMNSLCGKLAGNSEAVRELVRQNPNVDCLDVDLLSSRFTPADPV